MRRSKNKEEKEKKEMRKASQKARNKKVIGMIIMSKGTK
jgi:hypothetical protein